MSDVNNCPGCGKPLFAGEVCSTCNRRRLKEVTPQ